MLNKIKSWWISLLMRLLIGPKLQGQVRHYGYISYGNTTKVNLITSTISKTKELNFDVEFKMPTVNKHGKPYTSQENKEILSGKSIETLAKRYGRTPGAIRVQKHRLQKEENNK